MKRFCKFGMALCLIASMTQTVWASAPSDAFLQAVEILGSKEIEEEAPKEENLPYVKPTEYIPALMYHHFAIRDMGQGDGITTMQAELEEQVTYLKEQGYCIISMEELDQILDKKEKEKDIDGDIGLDLKVKYVCITMDDGYYSNYDLAYPVFQKHQVPATVFAITDSITNQIGLKKFTWSNASEMVNKSKMNIYNHTANHIPISKTTTEDFVNAALEAEQVLEEKLPLQRTSVKALAYPNGQTNEELQKALAEEGFSLAFTVQPGVIHRTTSRMAIPRITVASGMTGAELVEKMEKTAARAMREMEQIKN